jgi:hypothetical protein
MTELMALKVRRDAAAARSAQSRFAGIVIFLSVRRPPHLGLDGEGV